MIESGRDHPLHDEPKQNETGPRFPLVVQVLVPYEKRFESQEEFEKFMEQDLLEMGYATRDDENKIVWEKSDEESWKKNYDDVPFPPKTIMDFIAYTKQDIDKGNYSLSELDFEENEDENQWFIKEDQ